VLADLFTASVSIGGSKCIIQKYDLVYPDTTNTNTCIFPQCTVKCILPEGAGQLQFVTVSDTSGTAASRLLSYAAPVVTSVSGCTNSSSGSGGGFSTIDCPRDGSSTVITVTGTNFGPINAKIMIGGVTAEPVSLSDYGMQHLVHTVAMALVPSGSGVAQTVNVIQDNGKVSTLPIDHLRTQKYSASFQTITSH
jgi:hypothetical protein